MDYEELLKKYQALLIENNDLRAENKSLRTRLGIFGRQTSCTEDMLKKAGVQVVFQPNIHQKFAVIDQRLVWYGSINLLSFGNAEESMMRLESSNIANELLNTVLPTS